MFKVGLHDLASQNNHYYMAPILGCAPTLLGINYPHIMSKGTEMFYKAATARKAAPIKPSRISDLSEPLAVGLAEAEDDVADPVPLDAAVAVVAPPVDVGAAAFNDFGVLTVVDEDTPTAGVVAAPEVAAAAVDDEKDADKEANVAAAPLPVEVRTAGRRVPMFPPATHTPATF
jgi:hypothetical protein